MIEELWELTEESAEAAKPFISYLARNCPDMATLQMLRLLALAKVHLPPVTTGEANFLVRCLCGFDLPPADTVPSADLPEMIGEHIRETFMVEFGAEGLAEEMKKFGHDPAWQAQFRKMPENVFANRLETALDPFQAYLLVVAVECYWARQFSTQDANLSDFINIEEKEDDGLRGYQPPE